MGAQRGSENRPKGYEEELETYLRLLLELGQGVSLHLLLLSWFAARYSVVQVLVVGWSLWCLVG